MPSELGSSLRSAVTPQNLRFHLNIHALNFLLAYEGAESLPSLFFVFVW